MEGRKTLCKPWPGKLDEWWRPVNEAGELVAPGERLCGHRDCMSSLHVIPEAVAHGTAA